MDFALKYNKYEKKHFLHVLVTYLIFLARFWGSLTKVALVL